MMLKCRYFFLGKISPLTNFRIEIRKSGTLEIANMYFQDPHMSDDIFFFAQKLGAFLLTLISLDPG